MLNGNVKVKLANTKITFVRQKILQSGITLQDKCNFMRKCRAELNLESA